MVIRLMPNTTVFSLLRNAQLHWIGLSVLFVCAFVQVSHKTVALDPTQSALVECYGDCLNGDVDKSDFHFLNQEQPTLAIIPQAFTANLGNVVYFPSSYISAFHPRGPPVSLLNV